MAEPSSHTVRLFINDQPVDAPAGASVREILATRDPALAGALDTGGVYVTDGVGRRIHPDAAAAPGAIFRVIRSARRLPPPPA